MSEQPADVGRVADLTLPPYGYSLRVDRRDGHTYARWFTARPGVAAVLAWLQWLAYRAGSRRRRPAQITVVRIFRNTHREHLASRQACTRITGCPSVAVPLRRRRLSQRCT